MKNKKHMTHNGLVNEVTLQLTSRFLPDPRDIKERINALIEVRGVTRFSVREIASCSVFRKSILVDVKIVNHTNIWQVLTCHCHATCDGLITLLRCHQI